ncbi:MAG: metallophosphoesterase [Patescibacteria group bacterium]|nr:metallophosphoesterase [Patescibacteria group bacterium]
MPRVLTLALFLGTFAAFLYLANLVVFFALAAMLGITSARELTALGYSLTILSGSFIAASIWGSYQYNWFTRHFYRSSAVWIGLFTYLFFASVAYGLVVGVTGSTDSWLGIFLIAVALAVSIYGFLHMRKIFVKEVHVTLPNLPQAWKGRRAVWVSDIHLGQLYDPAYGERVVKIVNSIPHDIVFIGGDLYDGTGAPDIEELAGPFGKCTAPLGTYFITGNHEEFGDNSRFLKAVRGVGIRALIDEKIEIDGLQIVGVDWAHARRRDAFGDILSRLSLERAKPTILLKHEPRDLDVAEAAGVSLTISGHTHDGQMWPFMYISRLVHKGFSYGLKSLKNMQVYVSSGTGTWGPPMRVGTDSEIVVITFD